jgi:hypothetical protein
MAAMVQGIYWVDAIAKAREKKSKADGFVAEKLEV